MDFNSIVSSLYEDIALAGPIGLSLSDIWKRAETISNLDEKTKDFLWSHLVNFESLIFFKTKNAIQEPFINLPKVLYNNERTLAIVESEGDAALTTQAAASKRDSSWRDISALIKSDIQRGSLSASETEIKYGPSLRIVAKHPELAQLNGQWDPLVPLPAKCAVLVNYLSRQRLDGALSCGALSPLNAAVGVKSTTIFHLKKISKLYGLIRWRKILVKKARLSRNTTGGTCAVLSRFISPSFLLPNRMMSLAKQLGDFITKSTTSARTLEVRLCTAALGWSGKQLRSVVNAFPDYFSFSYQKPSGVTSEIQEQQSIDDIDADDSKAASDEPKRGQRMYKCVTLQKPMNVISSVNSSSSKAIKTEDEEQENEEGVSIIEEEDDDASTSLESNDAHVLGQLCVVRAPLRVIWEQIAARGNTGVTLQELRAVPNFGILLSLLRRYIKMLVASGHVRWVNDQLGRQHVKRYFVTSKTFDSSSATSSEKKNASKSKKKIVKEESIEGTSTGKSLFSASLVASSRKQIIESCLVDRRALLLSEITAKLRTVDSKIQGSVDRRTVQRLCNELVDNKRIGSVVKPLKAGDGKVVNIYTAYGLDANDKAIMEAVARRDRCVKPIAVPVADDTELICGSLKIRRVNAGRVALLQPKMQRIEALHALLWYLVHGEGQKENLPDQLAACVSSVDRFNRSEDLPPGWIRLSAALDAMPLQLLAFICPVALAILSPEAVTAAINSGLTFGQLAPDLRASALHTWGSFSLAGELREQILVMNALCLITFLERRSHSSSHLRTCIYVHRSTPICPLPLAGEEDQLTTKTKTTFETGKDIVMFWSDLRSESLVSPASRLSNKNGAAEGQQQSQQQQPQEKTKKSRLAQLSRLSLSVPSFDSAPVVRPAPIGNGLGPGGSDSRLRISVNTFWNACKWTPVPRLDEEYQAALNQRRRTKLMALAGQYLRRRRKNMTSGQETLKRKRLLSASEGASSVRPPKVKHIRAGASSTRKRGDTGENAEATVAKRRKINAPKSKAAKKNPADGPKTLIRRRRRLIKSQNILTHTDVAEGLEESGKMYKTLQNLLDSISAYDEYFRTPDSANSTLDEESLKSIAERDLATLALLAFHACVTTNTPRILLQSQSIPSFQDVRRSSVFPAVEIGNRGWVSHAVDLLIQLYPSYKRTTLIFQFILAAVDLILTDKSIVSLASQPDNAAAMKNLWEEIYAKFRSKEFLREAFTILHSWSNSRPRHALALRKVELSVVTVSRLHVVSEFWGPSNRDVWSRMLVFPSLGDLARENKAGDEHKLRFAISEQTMCAFLICTRLLQPQPKSNANQEQAEIDRTAPSLDDIEFNRSAVYNQLVASDCSIIKAALARLISAKITKRDFVDSVLYGKTKTTLEEEASDAHIGDYSLTSGVRFQLTSPHIIRASNLLARIGAFIMSAGSSNHTDTSNPNETLSFDLKTNDRSAPVFHVFISSLGVICLTGALNAKSKWFSLDVDAVPIDKVVISSAAPESERTTGARFSKQPEIELSVWPLNLQVEKNHLTSYRDISDRLPKSNSLKFPAKLPLSNDALTNGSQAGADYVASLLKERLPSCKSSIFELVGLYQVIHDYGVFGCTFEELCTKMGKHNLRALLEELTAAELAVRVGHSEERLVTTNLAFSTWLMTSPPMYPWPWANADGSVNFPGLRALLASVAFIIVEFPGISDVAISKRIGSAISMVALNKLLQMLVGVGVVRHVIFAVESSPTTSSGIGLFDDPPDVSTVQSDMEYLKPTSSLSSVYWVEPAGLMKLSVLMCVSKPPNNPL